MPEKIFDIIPPKKENKIILEEKRIVRKKRSFLKTSLFFIILLVVLGITGFLLFSKVEIELILETETLSFEEIITVDLTVEQREGSLFPGQVLTNESFASKEFLASGKAADEQKAKGVIRVYNSYSESARTLVPSRFVSADGKLFWSIEKTKIPGLTYNKGKIVPGEVDVLVEAAEAGEEYNIESTTFALPALAGTALYTTIYAKSFSPMSGGSKGEVAQITKQDLEIAKDSLSKELKNQNKSSFETVVSQGLIFLGGTVSDKIIEESSSNESGDVVDSFIYDMKVESKAFVFKESDIQDFAKEQIGLKIEQNKIIKQDSLKINYSVEEIDFGTGKLILTLNIEAKVYEDINLDDVKKAISGKSLKQASILLNNLSGVKSIDIKSWFLKKNVPDELEKVEIVLRVD
jgi:hypothetical protein